MEHQRLFTARQNPFPGINQTSVKGSTTQSLHPEGLVEQAGQAEKRPAGCMSTGEKQEENIQKDPFLTSLKETKYTGS